MTSERQTKQPPAPQPAQPEPAAGDGKQGLITPERMTPTAVPVKEE